MLLGCVRGLIVPCRPAVLFTFACGNDCPAMRHLSRKPQRLRDKDHLLDSQWSPGRLPHAGKKKVADDRYFAVRFEKPAAAADSSSTEQASKTDEAAADRRHLNIHKTERGERAFSLPDGAGRGVILPSSSRPKRDVLIDQTEAAVEQAEAWLKRQAEFEAMSPEERTRVLEAENSEFFTDESYQRISAEMWEGLIQDPTTIPDLRRMMQDQKTQREFVDSQTRFDPEGYQGLGALNGVVYASELTGVPVPLSRLTQVFELALELKQPLHVEAALEFVFKPVFLEQLTPQFFDYTLGVVQTLGANLPYFASVLHDAIEELGEVDRLGNAADWLRCLADVRAALEASSAEDKDEVLAHIVELQEQLTASLRTN